MTQFATFRASSLYCVECRDAQPVQEKLVQVFPDKQIYEYLCVRCGGKVGNREVSLGSNFLEEETADPATTRIKIV
ncbi:MAG: hypothetical protein JWL59_1640 [Chthoniobacteraceae bacterium]|nr:hypothetical protein [Chthoniobacteraceae bacterium]